MNGTGKLVGGILVGAVVGAALGILFAPGKGSDTRKKISSKGGELTDGMKEKFNKFFNEVKDEYDNVKGKATELAQDGKTKANGFVEDIRSKI